jgi:hypothetical protein
MSVTKNRFSKSVNDNIKDKSETNLQAIEKWEIHIYKLIHHGDNKMYKGMILFWFLPLLFRLSII